ncbi:tyrosine-type recombinase/integrase [Planctomycetota bacterium]
MTLASLPALLQAFFLDRLLRERSASAHTIAAYRDAFRLLLPFAKQRVGKAPSNLDVGDLDAPLIGDFLDHLEKKRGNSARTRNTRLAAIHSFFRYVALRELAYALTCQRVLAIPTKRHERKDIEYLTRPEAEALIAIPNLSTWNGRRDRALLLLAVQTGLRVSELIGLRCKDIVLGPGAHVHCKGKGRKERCTPLRRDAVAVIEPWLRERSGQANEPLFPSVRGGFLSRDAVERLVAKHVAAAEQTCPSLRRKNVTPHVLRHTAAMDLLQHGVDRSVIALWLGHESVETTQIYLHADLRLKEQALARTTPLGAQPARYRPDDDLLAFLEGL